MSVNYREYIQSDAWRDIALRVKLKSGSRCMLCNSPKNLDVHHRTYAHLGREREHMEDLICLCRECHQSHHMVMRERKTFGAVKMREASAPVPSSWTPPITRPGKKDWRQVVLEKRAERKTKKLMRKEREVRIQEEAKARKIQGFAKIPNPGKEKPRQGLV